MEESDSPLTISPHEHQLKYPHMKMHLQKNKQHLVLA
jgi:hypothetical protein